MRSYSGLFTLGLFTLVGCTRLSGPSPGARMGTPNNEQIASAGDTSDCCAQCPLALSGATVTYAESSGGGSMVFSAPDPELQALRERVQELAAYHNHQQKKLAMMTMPHEARAVETDSGARIEITTPVNNDLPALQREIENEVQWMQGGGCELARSECTCQQGRNTPLSADSPTQAPRDEGARDEQPTGQSHP